MGANVLGYFKSGRTAAFFAGLAACITIAMLAWNVYNEIDDQSSAQTDNLQWSLSQTEVEFQEFNARLRPDTDLDRLRQRFDVFYSRVLTLRRAQVFAELRASDNFDDDLHMLEAFLSETLPLMDVSDIELTRNLPPLAAMAEDVRPVVRSLANSGLRLFSEKADAQRADIKRTMVQLALALMVLISALGLGLLYMNALIQRISLREHEQQQTAARINTIMNTSLDGIIVSDTNSIITNFNAAAEIIFGHKAEDVIGKELGQIIVPPHLRGAHNAGMERMRSRGEKRVVGKGRVQLEAMHADGTIFPVELAIQAAATDEGEIFIAFLRDISRRAANQAELIQARDKAIAGEKSRSEFLATMSHEIRTPLNGLLGNMTLLR
ncbi:MAG: PAS domain S-box protein, partial [Sulfitobacter sp.]